MLTNIKFFRRIFYNQLIKYVERTNKTESSWGGVKSGHLCYFSTNNPLTSFLLGLPCWLDMIEVRQNNQSNYIIKVWRGDLRCNQPMFNTNEHRIAFLKECIALLDKK